MPTEIQIDTNTLRVVLLLKTCIWNLNHEFLKFDLCTTLTSLQAKIKQIVSVNQCYYFSIQVFRKVNQAKGVENTRGGFIPLFSASAGGSNPADPIP